ncbi:pentapeptide repeat-containing protein [Ancylothrix sp. C2]|uniref:pentapeptide repeat-containing protein n=1 Tax=Ancylothrix sp. D3o TaxID=2953691 RepID=UPI0021BB97C4|nr:pentapeptide repeat-containing protein [Ancylothrix sp. D3o]MCT7953200.1 pentapeptide repeat-containing protein [Ancylothrix sp. D3o]
MRNITLPELLKLYNAGLRNFSGITLENQSEADTTLKDADLSGIDLSFANLADVRLEWIDLSRAKLQGAYLHSSIFINVDLSYADLGDANLRRCYWSGVDLSVAYLGRAILFESDLRKCNLYYTDFEQAVLIRSTFDLAMNTEPFRIWGAFVLHMIMPDGTVDEGPRFVDYPD